MAPYDDEARMQELASLLDEDDNRNVAINPDSYDFHDDEKRNWNKFNGGWGKRSKWENFRGMNLLFFNFCITKSIFSLLFILVEKLIDYFIFHISSQFDIICILLYFEFPPSSNQMHIPDSAIYRSQSAGPW